MALAWFASPARAVAHEERLDELAQAPAAQASPNAAEPSPSAAAPSPAVAPTTPGGGPTPSGWGKVAKDDPGLVELKLADHYLSTGERADNDAERRSNYEVAKQHADKAVELLPNNAEAHFLRFAAAGRLAQMQGLAAAAFKLSELNRELDEVLRLDPNHAEALASRGGMLVKLPRLLGGNAEEGIRYLQRAVELDPNAVGKRLELAEAYQIVGRKDEAIAVTRDALAWAEKKKDEKKVEECKALIASLEAEK